MIGSTQTSPPFSSLHRPQPAWTFKVQMKTVWSEGRVTGSADKSLCSASKGLNALSLRRCWTWTWWKPTGGDSPSFSRRVLWDRSGSADRESLQQEIKLSGPSSSSSSAFCCRDWFAALKWAGVVYFTEVSSKAKPHMSGRLSVSVREDLSCRAGLCCRHKSDDNHTRVYPHFYLQSVSVVHSVEQKILCVTRCTM